jgi:hypothetical protein
MAKKTRKKAASKATKTSKALTRKKGAKRKSAKKKNAVTKKRRKVTAPKKSEPVAKKTPVEKKAPIETKAVAGEEVSKPPPENFLHKVEGAIGAVADTFTDAERLVQKFHPGASREPE